MNSQMTIAQQFAAACDVFDRDVQSRRLMCCIYDKFAGPDAKHHNCLGCNFDDLTEQISKYLQMATQNPTDFQLHHLFAMYAQLLNFCWERMTDVFDIIGVPDGYRVRHFSPFIRARCWANFFKHPKTFGWVVHHPHYTIKNTTDHKEVMHHLAKVRIVDDEFLKKYYSADCKPNAGKLRGEFVGFERSTAVVLPDVVELTSQVSSCLAQFVQMITENPVYVEMLNDTSTIENYFATVACESETSSVKSVAT
jgi:hypothetical protein